MNKPFVWSVQESSTTWLPGFQAPFLPHGLEKQLRIMTRSGEIGLEVGGIVGSIPLTNGDTLQIVPKVGIVNFFRMLLTAEGLFDELTNEFYELVAYAVTAEDALPRLLAQAYARELRVVQSSGLRFGRRKLRRTGQFARGRILALPTKMRLKIRSDAPVVYEESVRDFNTAENRVLSAAACIGFGYMAQINSKPDDFLADWGRRFFDPKTLPDDILEVNAWLVTGRYSGARGYYVKALTLAKLLLAQAGLSQATTTEVLGDSLVLNTATLFEKYVRSQLAQRYSREGLVVRKGGIPGEYLYSDGTFGLCPDITIARGVDYTTVGDAKYKVPDAADHYQLSVYMQAFEVRYGFLLCPAYSKEGPTILEKTTADNRRVFEVYLPLNNLDATHETLSHLHEAVPFL